MRWLSCFLILVFLIGLCYAEDKNSKFSDYYGYGLCIWVYKTKFEYQLQREWKTEKDMQKDLAKLEEKINKLKQEVMDIAKTFRGTMWAGRLYCIIPVSEDQERYLCPGVYCFFKKKIYAFCC